MTIYFEQGFCSCFEMDANCTVATFSSSSCCPRCALQEEADRRKLLDCVFVCGLYQDGTTGRREAFSREKYPEEVKEGEGGGAGGEKIFWRSMSGFNCTT